MKKLSHLASVFLAVGLIASANAASVAVNVECNDAGPLYQGSLDIPTPSQSFCTPGNSDSPSDFQVLHLSFNQPVRLSFNSLVYDLDLGELHSTACSLDTILSAPYGKATEVHTNRTVTLDLQSTFADNRVVYEGKIGTCNFKTVE
jgi:hypothetical protein